MNVAVASSPVPADETIVIDVRGLMVSYGAVTAVDGIDLSVREGEVVALLGRNGAGKTTTIETLEGYRRRSGGTARVFGLDPGERQNAKALASRVGVMLQAGGVYPGMGPREALALFSSYYDEPENPEALLERMELVAVARTPWRRLSGGEQRRLSMALALVGRPKLVFLDEPTAGVDPQGRLAIRGEISRLRESGVAVLLTTHEMDEAERVAGRIVIIDHGRVVASGTLDELTGGASGIRFSAPPGIDLASLETSLGAGVRREGSGRYVVDAAGEPGTIAALANWLADRGLPLAEMRAGSERLEELFLRVTGAPQSAAASNDSADGSGSEP